MLPKSNHKFSDAESMCDVDDWVPAEETFDELSADDALTRLLEDMHIFDLDDEECAERVARLSALWTNLPALVFDEIPTQAIEAAKKQLIDSGVKEANDEFLATDLLKAARRIRYSIPSDIQEDKTLRMITIRRTTNQPSFVEHNAGYINVRKKFSPNGEDKRIVKVLRELDSMLGESSREDGEQLCEVIGKLISSRFKTWMKLKEAHPYLLEHAFLGNSLISEAYASYDTPMIALKDLRGEKLLEFADQTGLLSIMTSPDMFVYCPTILKWFLLYLSDIGYSSWSLDDLEEITCLQRTYEQIAIDGGGLGGYLSRTKLMAADMHGHSYWNYYNNEGNIRFDRVMPRVVRVMEVAGEKNWDDAKIARILDIEISAVSEYRERYSLARRIAVEPTESDKFKVAVKISLEQAIKDGLDSEEKQEKLIEQICYRASDLLYLIDRNESNLEEVAETLTITESNELFLPESPSVQ